MIKLTKHFWAKEFVVSDLYPNLARAIMPNDDFLNRLFLLCSLGLEPHVRNKFGYTTILSGVRSVALNAAVGGFKKSQHLIAEAADFNCPEVKDMFLVYDHLDTRINWPGQLFYYKGRNFVHMALPRRGIKPVHRIYDEEVINV
jgi:hypothetical protein